MKNVRSDFVAMDPSVSVFDLKQIDVVEAGGFVEEKHVVEEQEEEFVISESTWIPPRRMDSSEILLPAEKPLVSTRFGHRKPINRASPEGTQLSLS